MENELYLVFKIARESKQMTQQELADRVGIDQSTLSHFEAGKPQIERQTLLKMAPLLSINPDFITGGHHNPFKSAQLVKILIKGALFLEKSIFGMLIRNNKTLEFISLIAHHNVVAKIDRAFMPDAVYAVLVRDDLNNIFIVRNKSNSTFLTGQNEESLEQKLSPLITYYGYNRRNIIFRKVKLGDPHTFDLIKEHWDSIRKEDVMSFFKINTQRETKIAAGLIYLKRKKYTLEEVELLHEKYKSLKTWNQ